MTDLSPNFVQHNSEALADGLTLLAQLDGISKTKVIERALATELQNNKSRLLRNCDRYFSTRNRVLREFLDAPKRQASKAGVRKGGRTPTHTQNL